jgi:ribosomal protein L11 methyltransferase
MCDVAWTEIRVRVERGVAEAVANFLLELGSPGLEVQEGGGQTTLKGYLRGNIEDQPERLSRYLQGLKAMGLADGYEGPELSLLGETDWFSHWRSRFHAFQVGRRLLIKPSWESVAAAPGQLVITIDPQMAFGTGEHVTTQFCLRALEELVRKNDIVLDVGTGSGILSIAAVKLGAKRALGLDVDPQAIATAQENARINGVSHRVDFSCCRLDRAVSSKSFHRILANVNSEVLLPLLSELKRVLKSKGHLILSGFLAEEEGTLRKALSESGLRLCRLECRGDWISAVAQGRGI